MMTFRPTRLCLFAVAVAAACEGQPDPVVLVREDFLAWRLDAPIQGAGGDWRWSAGAGCQLAARGSCGILYSDGGQDGAEMSMVDTCLSIQHGAAPCQVQLTPMIDESLKEDHRGLFLRVDQYEDRRGCDRRIRLGEGDVLYDSVKDGRAFAFVREFRPTQVARAVDLTRPLLLTFELTGVCEWRLAHVRVGLTRSSPPDFREP